MASASLSIAKASLLASCLRPDTTKLSRDDLLHFHTLLESCLSKCTPTNIQNTKSWLLQYILPSSLRTIALGKYLVNFSKSVTILPQPSAQPRACRQQLHLLYLLNDIFHHVTHHAVDTQTRQNVREHLAQPLSDLFANAAADNKARTIKRLRDLIQIWEHARYCDSRVVVELQNVLSSGKTADTTTNGKPEQKTLKELPWIMPATHGDSAAPFFDLPAANLMPHIVPNSSRPMRPDQIHALQLAAGPADESLVNAMKDFLKDVKSIDNPYTALEDEGIVADIDDMGQISYRNEADDLLGDTYYGWSRAFCEKMKRRGQDESNDSRGRTRSSDGSRDNSRSPRKRRRYSSSKSRSRSISEPRPNIRNRSPPGLDLKTRRPGPPPELDSRSQSPARPRFQNAQQSQQKLAPAQHNMPMSAFRPPQQHNMPMPFQSAPAALNGLPMPARPPNWQGPWPPPPPPPVGFPSGFSTVPFSTPPPLPKPQNQSYGR